MASALTDRMNWLHSEITSPGKVFSLFQIRPDQDHVVLRGIPGDQTHPSSVTGSVVLCSKLPIRGTIKIVLSCRIRHSRAATVNPYTTTNSTDTNIYQIRRREIVLREGSQTQALPPGNHEFSFKFDIDSDAPASLEGLHQIYVIWRLKASVDRGKLHQRIVAKRHLRVIRTFPADTIELQQAHELTGEWPGKTWYQFSTSSKAVIYGSKYKVTYKIHPYAKGLRPSTISFKLWEDLTVSASDAVIVKFPPWKTQKMVEELFHIVPDDLEMDENGDFVIEIEWQLPRSLLKCRQSYDEKLENRIDVRHRGIHSVVCKQASGKTAEIEAPILLTLYLSPDAYIDNRDQLRSEVPLDFADTQTYLESEVLPNYDRAQDDLLIEWPATSGYNTPAPWSNSGNPSASATPRNLSAQELRNLLEDVSLEQDLSRPNFNRSSSAPSFQLGSHDEEEEEADDEDDPEALRQLQENTMRNRQDEDLNPVSARAQSLSTSPDAINISMHTAPQPIPGSDSVSRSQSLSYSATGSPELRPPPSSLNSASNGAARAISFSLPSTQVRHAETGASPPNENAPELTPEALSRVPSYGTAIRTRAPSGPASGLPGYEDASGRPGQVVDDGISASPPAQGGDHGRIRAAVSSMFGGHLR